MQTPISSKIHIWGVMRSLIAVVVITLAVLLVLARAAYPLIAEQREQIQLWASEATGRPVRIERVEVGRKGLSPEFSLIGVSVLRDRASATSLVELERVRVVLSPWRSLLELRPSPSQIVIVGPEFELERTESGEVRLLGLTPDGVDAGENQLLYEWLASRPALEIEGARIHWRDTLHPDENLELEAVDFSLSNQGDEHRLSGRLGGAEESPVDGLQFQWVLYGQLGDEKPWPGALHIQAAELPLGALPYIRDYVSGRFSGQAWIAHRGFALESLVLNLLGDDWLLGGNGRTDLLLDNLDGRMQWTRQDAGWRLQLHQFEADVDGRHWPAGELDFALLESPDGVRRLEWGGSHLDLAVAEYAGSWLAERLGRTIALPVNGLEGAIRQFRGAFDLEGLRDQNRAYAFKGVAADIGWQAEGSVPKVSGLSGTLALDERGGRAELRSEGLTVDANAWFQGPLQLDSLLGEVKWGTESAGGWQITAPAINLVTPDMTATARFNLNWPVEPAESPEIDGTLEISKLSVPRVPTYLPLKLFHKNLGDWLGRALIGGEVTTATLRVKGPLRQFPFNQGGGLFEVRSQLSGGLLDYQAGWPRLQALQGELIFTGSGMTGHLNSGRVLQTRLESVDVALPFSRGQQVVAVDGVARGAASSFMQFLADSPLANRFARLAEVMQPEGGGALKLALRIPLKRGAEYGVGGVVNVDGTDLNFPAINLRINHVQGDIGFSEAGVWADELTGELLGGPLAASIVTRGRATRIRAKGELVGLELQALLGLGGPESPGVLRGKTPWQGELTLDSAGSTLQLQSELKGLALQLPKPLGKPADAKRAFHFTGLQQAEGLRLRASLGSEFSADLEASAVDAGWTVTSGVVHAGVARSPPFAAAGRITLSTDLASLSLDDWLSWSRARGLLDEQSDSWPPLSLSLQAKQAAFLGQAFDEFNLSGEQRGQAWAFDLNSLQAQGGAEYDPEGYGLVTAELERLWLESPSLLGDGPEPGSGAGLEDAPGDERPTRIPGLDVTAADVQFKGWSLGALRLKAMRTPDALEIEQFQLAMEDAGLLQLSGQWRDTPPDGVTTHLKGTLKTGDFGAFLRRVEIGESLKGGKGVVDIDLNWPGSPAGFALASLNGTAAVNLRKGSVSTVEPGLGRVLGLISLDSIRRRLSLNFGDVVDKGLAYDTLVGGYKITQGRAETDALVLDGPAARIAIAGGADLGAETLEMELVTQPKVSGGLNTAVAIASPVAGAAMFLGRKLLGKPIDGLVGNHYRVSGSWQDPRVEPMTAP
ncbi:MAG: TIGR02099 family protein [Gammaproteobacteria bacterium]|nr:TIGR02099 family protein [Gammaproteobacteria bacterium]